MPPPPTRQVRRESLFPLGVTPDENKKQHATPAVVADAFHGAPAGLRGDGGRMRRNAVLCG